MYDFPSLCWQLRLGNISEQAGQPIMSMTGAIRRGAYWAWDIFTNRSSILRQYRDIMFFLEKPKLGDEKTKRYLKNIVRYAVKNTKYYERYEWGGFRFKDLPVVNKNIYKENFDSFISKEYRNKEVFRQYTNGSTGTPFVSLQNKEKRERVIAELKAFQEICGVKSHERIVYLEDLADLRRHKSWLTQFCQNIWRIDTSDLGNRNMSLMCGFIRKKHGKLLFSYASTLDWLGLYLNEHPEERKDLDLDVVIALGEALNPNTRRNCELYFGCRCKVLSRYSSQEMGILGQEVSERDGFILNRGSYYFECLELDRDIPAQEGEVGRIVITDLFNHAFPMIRYDTGDMGIFGRYANGRLFLKKIFGKKKDVLFSTDGTPISPVSIASNFLHRNDIKQWQLVQEAKDLYVLHINAVRGIEIDLDGIIQGLKRLLGLDARINIEFEDEIPWLAAGKRKYTICKL